MSYKKNGYNLILSTGAPLEYAEKIFDYLEVFDEFYSSTKQINNIGIEKLKRLKNNNINEFIYLGDSVKDFIIWDFCKKAIVVNLKRSKINKLYEKNIKVFNIIKTNQNTLKDYLKEIRIHQWSKNILIFVPISRS